MGIARILGIGATAACCDVQYLELINLVLLKVFNFANGKSAKSFFMRRNPREVRWTVLYRRKHKKGSIEEQKQRKSKRTQKFNRGYNGFTLEQILQKRNQTSQVRKALREEAIRYDHFDLYSTIYFL